MLELTEQESFRFIHANAPIEYLLESGYSEEEAIDFLWQFAFEEGEQQTTRQIIAGLRRTFAGRSAYEQGALLEQHFAGGSGWVLTDKELFLCISQLCLHPTEDVLSVLASFPEPHQTLTRLHLVKEKKLGSLPKELLPSICHLWLSAKGTLWSQLRRSGTRKAFERIFGLQTWQAACLNFLQEEVLEDQARIPSSYLEKAGLETLATIAARQAYEWEALTKLIVSHGERALGALEERLFPFLEALAAGEGSSWHSLNGWPGLAMLTPYRLLLEEAKQPVPEPLLLWLARLCQNPKVVQLEDWYPILSEEQRAYMVLQAFSRQFFAQEQCGTIRVEGFPEKLVACIAATDHSDIRLGCIERGMRKSENVFLDALEQATHADYPTKKKQLFITMLNHSNTPESRQAIGRLLLHKSKPLREQASLLLKQQGDDVLPSVREALLAKRKATRQLGLGLLKSLGSSKACAALAREVYTSTKDDELKEALKPLCPPDEAGEVGAQERLSDEEAGTALLVEHLASTKKEVREGAMKGLVAAGKSATPYLLPMLKARQKNKRFGAASVLAKTGDPVALPALQEAAAKEKTNDVRTLLLNAVYMCSGDDHRLEGQSAEALEAILTSVPVLPIPDFLDVDTLPPLAWKSGEPLSKEATIGWLHLLAHETKDVPCQQLRAIRSKLDPDALDAFGEAPVFRQQTNEAPTWVSLVPLIAVSEYQMRAMYRQWSSEDAFFRHGGRVAAIWLHTRRKECSHLPKVVAQIETALATLAPDVEPTLEELYMFREEVSDVYSLLDNHSELSWENRENTTIAPALCRRVKQALFQDFIWQVFPSSFPALGQPLVAWDIALLPYPDGDFPPDLIDLLDEDRKNLESNITKQFEACQARLRARPSTRWTGWGWRRLFWDEPAWRLTATSFIFVAEGGSPFMLAPDGTCVDVEGHTVTFSKDIFVSLVNVESMPDDQRDAWERRYKALQEEWIACQPEDELPKLDASPLVRLRDALSHEPSTALWESICRIIHSAPDDDSFQITADYLTSHIDERWDGLERSAPESWWRSALGLEQPPKEAEERAPSHLYKCLSASNAIQIWDVWIKKPQATRLLQGDWSFVRSLLLGKVRIDPEILELFEGRVLFPELRSLSFYGYENLEESEQKDAERMLARVISNNPHEELCLHFELDWKQAEELVAMGLFDGVKHLSFQNRLVPPPVLQVLDQCEGLKGLRKLTIGHSFDNDSLCFFAKECSFPQLESISMRGWRRFDLSVRYRVEAFESLAQSRQFPSLQHILFENFVLGHEKMDPKKEWLDALLASQTLPKELLINLRTDYPHLLD